MLAHKGPKHVQLLLLAFSIAVNYADVNTNEDLMTCALVALDSFPVWKAVMSVTSMSLMVIRVRGIDLNWNTTGWPTLKT
jgi:hypothetical protein